MYWSFNIITFQLLIRFIMIIMISCKDSNVLYKTEWRTPVCTVRVSTCYWPCAVTLRSDSLQWLCAAGPGASSAGWWTLPLYRGGRRNSTQQLHSGCVECLETWCRCWDIISYDDCEVTPMSQYTYLPSTETGNRCQVTYRRDSAGMLVMGDDH